MRNLDGTRPNAFYMISRACGSVLNSSTHPVSRTHLVTSGRCLLLDSVLLFLLVLRYTITKLRNAGASAFLPLDHHIYLHKVVGVLVLALAWVHSTMHFCTFSKENLRFRK